MAKCRDSSRAGMRGKRTQLMQACARTDLSAKGMCTLAPFSVSLIHSPAVLWGRTGRVPEREGGKNRDLSHLIVHSGPEPTGDPYLSVQSVFISDSGKIVDDKVVPAAEVCTIFP